MNLSWTVACWRPASQNLIREFYFFPPDPPFVIVEVGNSRGKYGDVSRWWVFSREGLLSHKKRMSLGLRDSVIDVSAEKAALGDREKRDRV